MKRLLLLFTLAAISCAAMPPASKVFQLSCTLPADLPEVTGAEFYGANYTQTSWTLLGTANGTNGQSVAISLPANRYDVFTAVSVGSDGSKSDYAPVVTNSIPAKPVVKIK